MAYSAVDVESDLENFLFNKSYSALTVCKRHHIYGQTTNKNTMIHSKNSQWYIFNLNFDVKVLVLINCDMFDFVET